MGKDRTKWPSSYLNCEYCGSAYDYAKHVRVCVRKGLTGFEANGQPAGEIEPAARDWKAFRGLLKPQRTGLAELPEWVRCLLDAT